MASNLTIYNRFITAGSGSTLYFYNGQAGNGGWATVV